MDELDIVRRPIRPVRTEQSEWHQMAPLYQSPAFWRGAIRMRQTLGAADQKAMDRLNALLSAAEAHAMDALTPAPTEIPEFAAWLTRHPPVRRVQ